MMVNLISEERELEKVKTLVTGNHSKSPVEEFFEDLSNFCKHNLRRFTEVLNGLRSPPYLGFTLRQILVD